MQAVYITGDLARGLDSEIVDITVIGDKIDSAYLITLTEKAEKYINRKIRALVYNIDEKIKIEEPKLLIFGEVIK